MNSLLFFRELNIYKFNVQNLFLFVKFMILRKFINNIILLGVPPPIKIEFKCLSFILNLHKSYFKSKIS